MPTTTYTELAFVKLAADKARQHLNDALSYLEDALEGPDEVSADNARWHAEEATVHLAHLTELLK